MDTAISPLGLYLIDLIYRAEYIMGLVFFISWTLLALNLSSDRFRDHLKEKNIRFPVRKVFWIAVTATTLALLLPSKETMLQMLAAF